MKLLHPRAKIGTISFIGGPQMTYWLTCMRTGTGDPPAKINYGPLIQFVSMSLMSYNDDKTWFIAKLRQLMLEKEEALRGGDGDRDGFKVSK